MFCLERTPFQALSPPTSSQASKGHETGPFQQYQTSLKQRLLGRTAQLDAVLSTLEQAARTIQSDLASVLSDRSEAGMSVSACIACPHVGSDKFTVLSDKLSQRPISPWPSQLRVQWLRFWRRRPMSLLLQDAVRTRACVYLSQKLMNSRRCSSCWSCQRFR